MSLVFVCIFIRKRSDEQRKKHTHRSNGNWIELEHCQLLRSFVVIGLCIVISFVSEFLFFREGCGKVSTSEIQKYMRSVYSYTR